MLTFIQAHWRWALLAPLLMVLGTVLHEGAHALMTLALGGTVEDVSVLPAFGPHGLRFGWVDWSDLDASGSALALLAPFLAAHVHALAGTLVIPRVKAPLGKLLFFTSVLLPLFDISMLHGGLFARRPSADLSHFEDYALLFALIGWPTLFGLGVLAWRAFRSQWAGLERDQFALLLVMLLALPWLRFITGLTH